MLRPLLSFITDVVVQTTCAHGSDHSEGMQLIGVIVQGLDNPFKAARYHSLVIDKDSCPSDLEVTAWTDDGIIMGVQHRQHAHIQVD